MSFELTPKTFFTLSRYLFGLGIVVFVLLGGWYIATHTSDEIAAASTRTEKNILFPAPRKSEKRPNSSPPIQFRSSFFSLSPIPITYKLPDLRPHILYHGTNLRPDAPLTESRILFSMRGDSKIFSAKAGEKIPIIYDAQHIPRKWMVYLKENTDSAPEKASPSFLSISFMPQGNTATVSLEFSPPQEHGALLEASQELKQFTVTCSPIPTAHGDLQKWRLGEYTVDSTLLDRQGISWYGKDMIIETLGDDAWSYQKGRQRVQCGSGEGSYVLWVQEGDCFIFENGLWIPETPGPATQGKSLLVASKIDDRSIFWILWNQDGTFHYPLQTLRKEPLTDSNKSAIPEIKIMGARSKSRWIAEINGIRLVLQANDWLIFPEEGKSPLIIDSPTLLTDYIEGRVNGSLLVLEGTKKIENTPCLVGRLFNPTRSDVRSIEVSLYRSWEKPRAAQSDAGSKNHSDRDDEDLFDDEFDDEFDDDIEDDESDDDDLFDDTFDDAE